MTRLTKGTGQLLLEKNLLIRALLVGETIGVTDYGVL